MDNLLTVKDCAKKLKISERTIWRLIYEKKFCDTLKIGKQVRVKENVLAEWTDRQVRQEQAYKNRQNENFLKKLNSSII